jgi:hypothetical protein
MAATIRRNDRDFALPREFIFKSEALATAAAVTLAAADMAGTEGSGIIRSWRYPCGQNPASARFPIREYTWREALWEFRGVIADCDSI